MTARAQWILHYKNHSPSLPIDINADDPELGLEAAWSGDDADIIHGGERGKHIEWVELVPKTVEFKGPRVAIEVKYGGGANGLPMNFVAEVQDVNGPDELNHKFGVFKTPGWALTVRVNKRLTT